MTKQQFDDLYLGKAVHCDTEEKANKFLELAHGVGYKWSSGMSLLEATNRWSNNKKYTYYTIEKSWLSGVIGLMYGDLRIVNGKERPIVKFKLEKETFNVGDVVYDKSGNKGEITELSYLVLFEKAQYAMYANELFKTKPLQKITRKELAEKGYEVE